MNAETTASASERPDEERAALFEALDRLEDEPRGLLVEHYFQKASLDDIAQRTQLSKRAIWNKMDRARRSLKETLQILGLTAVVPNPTSILEASTPVALTTDLVSGVLAKMAVPSAATTSTLPSELCKGSLTSAPKALALGGIVMTVKKSTWTTLAITAAFVLGLGLGIGLMFRTRDTSQGTAVVRSAQGPGKDRSASLPTTQGNAPAPAAPSGKPAAGDRKDSPSNGTSLKALLAEYRKKLDEKFPDRAAMRKRFRALEGAHVDAEDKEALEYYRQLVNWKERQLSSLKDPILSDPASFLEFFNSPEAVGYLEGILSTVFRNDTPWSTLPPVLKDGLLALLQSGSSEQRAEILRFTAYLDIPRDFSDAARSLMFDADPDVQSAAIGRHNDARPYTEAEADGLRLLAQSTTNSSLASQAVWALARCGTPEFAEFAFSLATAPGSNMGGVTAAFQMLLTECTKSTSSTPYEQRVINAICQWQNARRWDDKQIRGYSQYLLGYSALPIVNSLPTFFDQAAGHATSSDLASRLTALATAIRSGTTDEIALRRIFDSSTPPTFGSVPGE